MFRGPNDTLTGYRRAATGLYLPSTGSTVVDPKTALQAICVAYWTMDEVSAGAGAVGRADATGRGNTLVDNNTTPSAAGLVGNAANLTAASSEYFTLADNADVSMGALDFAIAGWVNLTSKGAVRNIVLKASGGNATNTEYHLRYFHTSDRFDFRVADGVATQTSVQADNLGSPSTATWYFIVAQHVQGSHIEISVNGGTANTAAHTAGCWDSTIALGVGAVPTTGGSPMDGLLDEWGIYKGRLTQAMIDYLYNGGAGRALYP